MLEVTAEQEQAYIAAAKELKGGHRRQFMARIVKAMGRGGQSWAERVLGWERKTIRKGLRELEQGIAPRPNPGGPGRPRAEMLLPNLLEDIKTVVDTQTQTDPTFKTTRLYTRLSTRAVRQALIDHHGYRDEELPTEETLRVKLNALNYKLRAVAKSKPQKKTPETDPIFKHLILIHVAAAQSEKVLRISIDAKATIKMGEFSRHGQSRSPVKALDHDFAEGEGKVHLLGFYLPDEGETYFFFLPCTSSLTADAIVDCLELLWESLKARFPTVEKLLLNLDNGPENNSYRRQFVKRIVDFVDEQGLHLELAYYPPYHSKYNPIERVWGVLEQHWNGILLTDLKTVVAMAGSMTYHGLEPVITIVEKIYEKGVTLGKKAFAALNRRLDRLKDLPKYSVNIAPLPSEAP